MRLLHTADWHLADRLRHIDRTPDLRRAVEQVAQYALGEHVDVLLVAGDLFSELARPDTFQDAVAHLSDTFRPFLLSGGTIIAVTGNHDNPVFCQTLCRAFQLAAPSEARGGDRLPSGRLYLAIRPGFFRLGDRRGNEVQFVCMPYPTSGLQGNDHSYRSLAEKHEALRSRYEQRLRSIRSRLEPQLPAVLVAHINALASATADSTRVTAHDDVLVDACVLLSGWSYAALGHIHQPQALLGQPHLRYAGSIERLDIGERLDTKGVVLVELNDRKLAGAPKLLPLDATPFYDVRIRNPHRELSQLRQRYPDAERALVRCHVSYRPGEDNLCAILSEISRIFPRCYERTWSAEHSRGRAPSQARTCQGPDDGIENLHLPAEEPTLLETVLAYLGTQLPRDDPDREALLELARQLAQGVQ